MAPNEYHIRALRLLAEDARLTNRTTDLLAGLVLLNPVALRGEPTMMPISELMEILGLEHASTGRNTPGPDAMADALHDVAQACWRMPSWRGFTTGSFLEHYWVSSGSGLLHFQIDGGFIVALERISRHLDRAAGASGRNQSR
nr:hypothetical protein [uncultured Massilia sp.]